MKPPPPEEELLSAAVEHAATHAVLDATPPDRRRALAQLGQGALAAAVSTVLPLDAARAMAADKPKAVEVKDLSIAFIPITCATPIIMAEPMGFYAKHGLNAKVRRAAGWAVVRDWAANGEVHAAHMLSPMPLALTLGAGSPQVPFLMPAIENLNGQAITLHKKHAGVTSAKQMKGFRFCVPFQYSMHNYLLRYFLAEGGLNPDKDVEIRIVPPPEMVANLSAGNVDGYLAPDPFNQRAVYDGVGFIYMLSKEIWDGHPCCAFAIPQKFARENPGTFQALFRSIVDATHFSAKRENRKQIAAAIAPKNYLNQPVTVLEQVLTGKFADGRGKIREVPDRIDFNPFPWHSMAVWILTQMKRWKHIDGDLDYKKIAEQVYLATECDKISREMGHKAQPATYTKHTIMGKVFDPAKAAAYVESFAIRG